jgi:hypothetical protein
MLVGRIEREHVYSNLSSAIRVYIIEHYHPTPDHLALGRTPAPATIADHDAAPISGAAGHSSAR